VCTAIFSEYAVEAWMSSRVEKGLISLITNKLWSFFATLGHPVSTNDYLNRKKKNDNFFCQLRRLQITSLL
jgi:hypothetical protein